MSSFDPSKHHLILIPGVAKSGTSSLYGDLVQFESVIKGKSKEVNTPLNPDSIQAFWYPILNPGQETRGWLIDGSQNYCWDWKHKDLEFLAKQPFQQIKVIIMFRNPVFRSVSNYAMNRKQHQWKAEYSEVWKQYVNERGQRRMADYAGFYKRNVKLFGGSNVLPVIAEQYFQNRLQVLEEIRQFLGFCDAIQHFNHQVISPLNDSPQNYNLEDELFMKLNQHFRKTVRNFERVTGKSTPWNFKS